MPPHYDNRLALLEFREVGFSREGRQVLRGLSFEVSAGETLVLLGRSGSGKTTIVRLILKLLEPDSGEIVFEGKNVANWNAIELRRRIGYVIQEVGLLPHWSVAANIALVPKLLGWPKDRMDERVRELLNQISMPAADYETRLPNQLSGGQRQRVGVARALAANPGLLLFDEPFGALDPLSRAEMQRQFLALREKHRAAAVFITHDVNEALRLASRIAVLDEGLIETVLAPPNFRLAQTPVARAFLNTLAQREA